MPFEPRGADGALTDPPRALVAERDNSAVRLDGLVWFDSPERGEAIEVTDRMMLARVRPALAGAGIDIPCLTMQVLAHDRTEATDGDRARQREGWPARGGAPPREGWPARGGAPPRWRPRGAQGQRPYPNGAGGRAP